MRPIFAAIVLCTAIPTAAAAQMFQCDGRLIEAGASTERVRELCGPPTSVRRSELVNPEGLYGSLGEERTPVEVWVYDQGENLFSKRLTFEDGILQTIVDGGYGD